MQKISTGMLSRRSLLKTGGALAATALAAPFYARSAIAQTGTVRVLGVTTCALDRWDGFTVDTGLNLEFTAINSDPGLYVQEVVANEAGDDFDIFIFDGGIEDRLGTSGHFQVLDPAAMARWANVSDDVKASPLLQGPDGTQYGAPIVFNADSFGYWHDEVGDGADELSWGEVFENEALLGKVALEDTWLSTLPNAALYLMSKGVSIGNPSDMTPDEAKIVVDFLIERKRAGQFRAFWNSYEESVDLLGNREVLAAACWEPAVKQLQREGKAVSYANCIEGYSKWMIGAYLPSQAEGERLVNAYKAIDWFLGGNYGANIAVTQGYATAVPEDALQFANDAGWSEEQIGAIRFNIEKVNRKMALPFYWQNAAPEHVRVIESEWQRFKQA